MVMHTDIPSRGQITALLRQRGSICVSIMLPTTRITRENRRDRLVLKNLAADAVAQLREQGHHRDDVAVIEESLANLIEDPLFWLHQADSLAVYVTPERIQTFRLPNELQSSVEVADRFHVKSLLRAVTFPQAAWVLALAQGGVRLLEIHRDGPPEEVEVPDMPSDAWATQAGDKTPRVRTIGLARQVDHALQGVLHASELPLIIAATDNIAALYRQVNTYPHLAVASISGNPERTPDTDLGTAARTILDDHYARQLDEIRTTFARRADEGRVALDIGDIARHATAGSVGTVLVDIDSSVPGTIDDVGRVTTGESSAGLHDVVDEIARRVHLTGGRVLAVRADDIPHGGPAAAILRFAP